jgi:hypothetical protein
MPFSDGDSERQQKSQAAQSTTRHWTDAGVASPIFVLKGSQQPIRVSHARKDVSPHWRRWLGAFSVVSFTGLSERLAVRFSFIILGNSVGLAC